MNLLAIETATENCSVALYANDKMYHQSSLAPQQHAQILLPCIEDLLLTSGIDRKAINGIVFGQGPGAFTGVRIAISIVQGLALGLDVPVLGVSTLKVMAYQILKREKPSGNARILIANDARMGEAYHVGYVVKDGLLTALYKESVSAPEDIPLADYDVFAGSAFAVFEVLKNTLTGKSNVFADIYPQADDLLSMVKEDFAEQAINVADAEPSYVRNEVVRK